MKGEDKMKWDEYMVLCGEHLDKADDLRFIGKYAEALKELDKLNWYISKAADKLKEAVDQ